MDKINKINEILNDFISMTQASWTYHKMSDLEKDVCLETLTSPTTISSLTAATQYKRNDKIIHDISWCILQSIYSSYLAGLGYTSPTWREEDDVPKF